jgi:ADP-glucose pyrophosphorylase
MRKFLATAAAITMMAAPMVAAEMKGRISDAMCNAKHAEGEHGSKKMTDRQCVEGCVKGGEKYVFIGEGDKVYKIDNQDFAGLKAHAGHEVTVTGTTKDNAVTITKIDMPAAKK